jgi:hypothetical protein
VKQAFLDKAKENLKIAQISFDNDKFQTGRTD